MLRDYIVVIKKEWERVERGGREVIFGSLIWEGESKNVVGRWEGTVEDIF